MEKDYLSFYNKVFKAELGVYIILGNVSFYMVSSYIFKSFNRNLVISLLLAGMTLNIFTIYARTSKQKRYEANLGPRYENDIKKYKSFFHDEQYWYFMV